MKLYEFFSVPALSDSDHEDHTKDKEAEKEKLVDRAKFLDIQGRKRNIQLELAKKFNIKFPSPAGGCLLCEKIYGARLKDILQHEKKISPELLSTLGNFRHFRPKETKGKIILGRNEIENARLEELNKKLMLTNASPKLALEILLMET
jgi:hypothetical protein